MVCVAVASSRISSEQPEEEATGSREDDVLLNVIRPDYERPAPPPPMKPLYRLTEDGRVQGKSCKLGLRLSGNETRFEMNLCLCVSMFLCRNSRGSLFCFKRPRLSVVQSGAGEGRHEDPVGYLARHILCTPVF